jgi:hypothetical protein
MRENKCSMSCYENENERKKRKTKEEVEYD